MRVFIPQEYVAIYFYRGVVLGTWVTRWLDEGFDVLSDFSRIQIVNGYVAHYDHSILFGSDEGAIRFKLMYL